MSEIVEKVEIEENLLEKDSAKTEKKESMPKIEEKPSPKREAHVSDEKKKEVAELKKLFTEYNTIALVDLTNLPSPQLQIMRKKLDGSLIKVSKKRLIRIALQNLKEKKGIQDFIPHLEKVMPALIFSKDNSFKLSSFLRKNKSKVAAKPGQIAPKDLQINAGPTPFAPGPMIGELGSLGIKATVEEGKIVVKQDAVVVKEGEEVNDKVADLLTKLDIKPMEIGLNLVAAYEDGLILDKDILDFDESLYVDEIKRIAGDAFKLTIGIGYVTKDNIQMLLSKAESEAKSLVDKAGIITNDSVKGMVAKAENEAGNVKNLVKDVPDESKEEKKEEPKKEESLKEQNSTENDEGDEKKMDTTEEIPTAEELAEKKKLKEEEETNKENLEEKKEEEKAPSVHELAEKKEETKTDDVPSIHELVEKKKDNDQGGQ